MSRHDPQFRAVSPSPFGLSLYTSFPQSHGRSGSECSSVSPMSSLAGSPTSSPTSPFRRMRRNHYFSSSSPSDTEPRSRSQSPFSLHSVLRGRGSLVLLRRRPSAVDLALSEERSRCDEDSIERQGLDLMEPRPVDPVAVPMDPNLNMFDLLEPNRKTGSFSSNRSSQVQQPRFVMGGIIEVMEGNA